MARNFIEINSNGDVTLEKEVTSTYEKSKNRKRHKGIFVGNIKIFR